MKILAIFSQRSFFQISIVILAFLSCAIFYEHNLKIYSDEYASLDAHLKRLEEEYNKALALNIRLKQQVNSQSDPAWIELTLIKGLGLTPEGHQKILFVKPVD